MYRPVELHLKIGQTYSIGSAADCRPAPINTGIAYVVPSVGFRLGMTLEHWLSSRPFLITHVSFPANSSTFSGGSSSYLSAPSGIGVIALYT